MSAVFQRDQDLSFLSIVIGLYHAHSAYGPDNHRCSVHRAFTRQRVHRRRRPSSYLHQQSIVRCQARSTAEDFFVLCTVRSTDTAE